MAKCSKCEKDAVFSDPKYCKYHFCAYFEDKVKKTIQQHKLLSKKDKVVVAASGGKDSLTILHILHKLGYHVQALAIDEGIKGYRDASLKTLKKYCSKQNIPLTIHSFKQHFSHSLDEILIKKPQRPCTVCGVLRRNLLNTYSKNFDVIATGHNLDDESQAIVMNLLKNNISLLKRQGPISGSKQQKGFTKRVKPLYFCSEKEVMTYAFVMQLTTSWSECPNVSQAFRLRVRDALNVLELHKPGSKKNILDWFLEYKSNLPKTHNTHKKCSLCGQPSAHLICNACQQVKAFTA